MVGQSGAEKAFAYRYFLLLLVTASVVGTSSVDDLAGTSRLGNDPMPLYMVDDARASQNGAFCLDGTSPGYYFTAAPASATAAEKSSWVLYFKGGGWCYDEASCAQRAGTELGSAKHFAKTFQFSGPMDSDPSISPFARFNRVVLWYCDGASFSGNNDTPYEYRDPKTNATTTLYFRGARVLGALLDTLRERHGLGDATDVLLSGGSAGGLSTFLHADRVRAYLEAHAPALQRFKAAPVSGFFLLHATATGEPLYPARMRYVYQMQNASSGVNSQCVASFASAADAWPCIFANYSYAHTATPLFPLQSALDAWQMGSIWLGDKQPCVQSKFRNCTAPQVADLNGYAHDLVRDLRGAGGSFGRAGNGGFVESCLEHCGAQNAQGFDTYAIRNTTMRQALAKWWDAPATDAAANHWYLPCNLRAAAPHQCNPTC
eukprot:g3607.t1